MFLSVPAEEVITIGKLDGWIDTLEEEQVWDEDEYYAHIDNLDFDFD